MVNDYTIDEKVLNKIYNYYLERKIIKDYFEEGYIEFEDGHMEYVKGKPRLFTRYNVHMETGFNNLTMSLRTEYQEMPILKEGKEFTIPCIDFHTILPFPIQMNEKFFNFLLTHLGSVYQDVPLVETGLYYHEKTDDHFLQIRSNYVMYFGLDINPHELWFHIARLALCLVASLRLHLSMFHND